MCTIGEGGRSKRDSKIGVVDPGAACAAPSLGDEDPAC